VKSPILNYLLIALATVGLLYLAFHGQDLSKAWEAIGSARPLPLLFGILIMFASHGVRAMRWQIVLRPLKRKTSLWAAFKATIAGYGMNNLIPRSGEILRPYMMSRRESIPLAGTLASVVVERLTDVLALAALIVFSLLSFERRVTTVFPMFSGDAIVILAVILAVLGGFILMFFSEQRTEQFLKLLTRPLPKGMALKISQIGRDFSTGLRGLERSSILPLVIGTAGIWMLYGISMYVSLQAFPERSMAALTLRDAFLLLTLSGIAFTIPTPGGTGSYHALITTGLSAIFGVAPSTALAYAVATHALSYIATTLFGLLFLVREGLSFSSARQIKTSSEELPSAAYIPQPSDGG